MSLDSNRKILIGSVMQSLDKRLIIGDTDNESVILVSILISYIEYCMEQYNAGNLEYFDKIKKLNKLVHELKYQCPDVCIYRDRLIITRLNTPPHIDDNIIELPISNSYQSLPYNEVIKNYSDAENDLISQVIILSLDNENDLLIDNNPVVINNIYQPNIDFTAKYEHGTGNLFLIQNLDTSPCTANIVTVNENDYNELTENYCVISIENDNIILQSIENSINEIPNDSIIYIHIDVTSMNEDDVLVLNNVVLDWWNNFKSENPLFLGSLIVNTIRNDVLDNNYVVGREQNRILSGINLDIFENSPQTQTTSIGQSVYNNMTERWLKNPVEGLLREAYKQGENIFLNDLEFLSWVQNKSLIVMSFVDESELAGSSDYSYHGVNINYIDLVFQPSSIYTNDYISWLNLLRPKLSFFKGVLYPLTRTDNSIVNSSLLQSISAIEATDLTPTEFNSLLGADKVNEYDVNTLQSFYDSIANNPYKNLNLLKDSGWSGNFTKFSPVINVITSEEFIEELDEILTGTSNVPVSMLKEIQLPIQNLGNQLSTNFSLKVRDNNLQQPLFSNEALITVNFNTDCEPTPNCQGTITQLNTGHRDTYTFTVADFTSDNNIDKVKIESVNIPSGQLKYFNLTIVPTNIPLVIPVSDIVSGNLIYIPDSTVQEEYNIEIVYSLSFQGSINYCQNSNTIQLTKIENPNKLPIITTEDKTIILPESSTVINTTVSYSGSGNYSIIWQQIFGNSVSLLNSTEEDLQIENLNEGIYKFKIIVITEEDNFIVEKVSTITVTT